MSANYIVRSLAAKYSKERFVEKPKKIFHVPHTTKV
jgi:hypothetical protein